MKEKSLKILVLGSGGREHALCWKIAQSPLLDKLYCAPGNGGIESVADCVTLDIESPDAVLHFAKEKAIDLVVIGPEGPLVSGLVDTFIAENIAAFGPVAAAQLEGSKGFTKDIAPPMTFQLPPMVVSNQPQMPMLILIPTPPLSLSKRMDWRQAKALSLLRLMLRRVPPSMIYLMAHSGKLAPSL